MPDPSSDEVLLQSNAERYVVYPIKYPLVWEFYQKHVAGFWTFDEIDLSRDGKDWDSLQPQEQHFIKMVLAFFAASDGIVMENLAERFMGEVQIPEARMFYGFQIAMEGIHSHTYAELVNAYVKDPEERVKMFTAIVHFPAIQKKAQWAIRFIESDRPFAERLAAFAIVEGVFFSGSFCAIYWLKKRQLLPGLTFSNELIARDEGLHTDFACLLFSMIRNRPSPDIIQDMMRDAVAIETEFVCEALPVDLIGMNSRLMGVYIQFVADRLLDALSIPRIYNVQNPFDWMDMISMSGKTSFFEKRVSEYKRQTKDAETVASGDSWPATMDVPF